MLRELVKESRALERVISGENLSYNDGESAIKRLFEFGTKKGLISDIDFKISEE